MKENEVGKRAFAMPITSTAHPPGSAAVFVAIGVYYLTGIV
jgi:acetoacetate decarboxylase